MDDARVICEAQGGCGVLGGSSRCRTGGHRGDWVRCERSPEDAEGYIELRGGATKIKCFGTRCLGGVEGSPEREGAEVSINVISELCPASGWRDGGSGLADRDECDGHIVGLYSGGNLTGST